MQALVPPPCSTGLDYTQSLQRRTAELEAELAQAEKSLGAKDEELAKLQGKADILQDEVLKRGMQIRNLDERWSEMYHEVNDLHIEVERLTFALKDSDNELESIRSNYENRIDELTTELNDVKELYNNRLKIEEVQEEEIERLKHKNKKRVKVAELRWLLDGHTDVLEEHRTAILTVREAIDQNRETASVTQRVMLATLDRHDGLISKALACIDNHSDSIYKQQQSIEGLWRHVNSMLAHINTGSAQENP